MIQCYLLKFSLIEIIRMLIRSNPISHHCFRILFPDILRHQPLCKIDLLHFEPSSGIQSSFRIWDDLAKWYQTALGRQVTSHSGAFLSQCFGVLPTYNMCIIREWVKTTVIASQIFQYITYFAIMNDIQGWYRTYVISIYDSMLVQ